MRLIAAILVSALLGVVLWNTVGSVTLKDVSPSYYGRIDQGDLAVTRINAEGVELVRDWIETQTRPSFDPVKILINQVWYNALTRGYEFAMWIEPEEYTPASEMYAIYQYENYILLRIEFQRRNRVLVASFTAAGLEEALQPFIVPE